MGKKETREENKIVERKKLKANRKKLKGERED